MTTVVSKAWESTGGVMPKELVPQQRMGNEEELAGTVLYLASKVSVPFQRTMIRSDAKSDCLSRRVDFVMAV